MLELLFNLFAVLEPFKLLVSALDDLVAHDGLRSLVNGSLQSRNVDLLSREKLKQSLLLLKAVCNQITVAVALFHALTKLLFVLRTALGDPDEDSLTEGFAFANHLGRMS